MDVNVYVHFVLPSQVKTQLERIERKIDLFTQGENSLMSKLTDALDAAEAAATRNANAEDAGTALLQTLSQMVAQLQTSTTDPATVDRINALATALNSKADAFGTAIVANTPASTAQPGVPPAG